MITVSIGRECGQESRDSRWYSTARHGGLESRVARLEARGTSRCQSRGTERQIKEIKKRDEKRDREGDKGTVGGGTCIVTFWSTEAEPCGGVMV